MNNRVPESSRHSESKLANRKTVRMLVLVAVGMFGFGFAMWPLYTVFCDLTGLGGRSVQRAADSSGVQTSDRELEVRFLATTNSGLPWVFQAVEKTKIVRLGELSKALYLAMNPTDEPILGHATYNVSPPEASLYFVKTECFCFTQQLLAAQESREMPVYYYIKPDLPEHIRDITLSYTFYRNNDEEALASALASTIGQD
jgi:cytochrome c oxidase assembly protein subunit 11